MCQEYRKILNIMVKRQATQTEGKENRTNPDSHTNIRYLRTPEKRERLKRSRRETKICQQQIKFLEQKLEQEIEQHGVKVDPDLHEDLVATMSEQQFNVFEQYPPGSFLRLFWEQQYSASQLKSSCGMKWEPAMIRFNYNSYNM